MSPSCPFRICLAMVVGVSPTAAGVTGYYLRLEPAGPFAGASGELVEGDVHCHLDHYGDGPGVEAWSFGVTAEAGAITAITTAGTDAGRLLAAGFERSELTTGEGNAGAVSTVVLPAGVTVTLPPQSSASVARLTATLRMPTEPPQFPLQGPRLLLVGGLRGSGDNVPLVVRAGGAEMAPSLVHLTLELRPSDPCALGEVNLGFSAQGLSSPTPFEGVLGAHEGFRSELDVFTDRGRRPRQRVFVNLISQLPGPGGIQGWSFGLRAGDSLRVLGATTSGTSVERYLDGGLVIVDTDPAECCVTPIPGVLSVVVLSLDGNALPPTGTESVLEIQLERDGEQGDGDTFSSLRFEDGLRSRGGNGQPVFNQVTVEGREPSICNQGFCELVLHLLPRERSAFIRGNANADFRLDLADPVWILNELFLGGPASPCREALDANDDGQVDIVDPLYLIRFQLLGGLPPPPPFPTCGADPEEDGAGPGCEETQLGCP